MKFKKVILMMLLLMTVLTIGTVSATDNNTLDEVINIENIQNNNEPIDTIYLEDESSEITTNNDLKLDEPTLNKENYILSSQDTKSLGDSNSHSMKISIKPAKVYSNKKIYYSAKLTDNGKPTSGVLLFLTIFDASNSCTGYYAKTNNQGIATFVLHPEHAGKYNLEVEVENYEKYGYAYADSYINVIQNPKVVTSVKAPIISAKYKENKYFEITVKNYRGKVIKNLKLTLEILTNGKSKYYHIKTNNKGIAKFNTKKLKIGTHIVYIYNTDWNQIEKEIKYDVFKQSKIVIKKKTAKKTTTTKKSSIKPVIKGKYNNKNIITVTVKDGKNTIKVKCKYIKSYEQYLGHIYKNGKRYDVNICYEKKNGMQGGKKGWWTRGTNGGMSDNAKIDGKYNKYCPVTSLKLH